MSATGSTSSAGTQSRSRSRSRSPPYSDARFPPPRYNSRYDQYSYRPARSAMSTALDDYREMRDRGRDRDRERDRPPPPRDDRYMPRNRDRYIFLIDGNPSLTPIVGTIAIHRITETNYPRPITMVLRHPPFYRVTIRQSPCRDPHDEKVRRISIAL